MDKEIKDIYFVVKPINEELDLISLNIPKEFLGGITIGIKWIKGFTRKDCIAQGGKIEKKYETSKNKKTGIKETLVTEICVLNTQEKKIDVQCYGAWIPVPKNKIKELFDIIERKLKER